MPSKIPCFFSELSKSEKVGEVLKQAFSFSFCYPSLSLEQNQCQMQKWYNVQFCRKKKCAGEYISSKHHSKPKHIPWIHAMNKQWRAFCICKLLFIEAVNSHMTPESSPEGCNWASFDSSPKIQKSQKKVLNLINTSGKRDESFIHFRGEKGYFNLSIRGRADANCPN